VKKITNIIYLAILGILSFFPVSVVFLSFSNLIKIIDELEGDSPSAQSASFSSEISLDFLYKLKFFVFIAPILSILMGIYFIVYIARTKRFHIITSVVWIICLIIPYLNMLTVPAFWIFLVFKEIKGTSNNTASGGLSTMAEHKYGQ